MRILHTADLHLGKTLENRSRLPEQEQLLDELCQIVQDEKIDVVLIAGDAFDTVNPPAVAEQLFYDSLARLSDHGLRQVIVIAGNHDNPDRLSAAQPIARNQGITLLGSPLTSPLRFYIKQTEQYLNVAALPYPSESRLKELLTDSPFEDMLQLQYDARIRRLFDELCQNFSPKDVNLAMSHLFVAGGQSTESERPIQVGGAYTVFTDSLPETAQYVALGHLHRPQTISSAKTLARYSGSPLAYSFSEAGYAKSITIVDVEPNQPAKMNEIYLSSGKPLVRWIAKKGLDEVYRWIDEKRDLNAWIDLEIHLEQVLSIEEIQRLRTSHAGFVGIHPIFPEMQATQESLKQSSIPIDELFRHFYFRQTGGAQPEDELVSLFLELLLDHEEQEDNELEKQA